MIYDGLLKQFCSWPVLFDSFGHPRFVYWGYHMRPTLRNWRPHEIVVHYSGGAQDITFDRTVWYLTKPNSAKVSAHFVIGKAGEVVMICPLDHVAWHAGKWPRNLDSFGIEVVHAGKINSRSIPEPYPQVQLDALITLCAQLCVLFRIPPIRIIGHRDIITTVCPWGLDVDMVKARVSDRISQ